MRTKILTILASVFLSGGLFAQSNTTVTAEGDNYTYTLDAPKEWQKDSKTAINQDLGAVFIPTGKSWESSSSVIYSSVAKLDLATNETMWDVINFYINMYKLSAPDLTIGDGDKISVDKGTNSATVIHLLGEKYGSFEAVAYIPQDGVVPFVVLSAETKEEFDANYDEFVQLVQSYSYTDNSNVAKK